jgi:heme exporter protein D
LTEVATHTGFILAAYLATAFVLAAIVGWIVLDGRSLRRRLAELEARGIRRRSAKGPQ